MQRIVDWLRANRAVALAAVALLLAGGTVAVVIDTDGDGPNPPQTFTILVNKASGDAVPTRTIEVPAAAVEQANASRLDDHDGSRSEQPAGVGQAQLDAADDQQEKLAASDQLPLVTPDAAPEQAGCRSQFVRNFSTRGGVRPRLFVLHYTVSPNRPGWSDVDAITSLFNTPSFAASSNYIVDNEGNCAYIVRESDKAWTQATFNPVSISVEVINTGSEPTYAGTAGLAKIAQVVSDATRRWEIPLQRGATSGCLVTRPGIVDHASLGACGGGHGDIAPFSTQAVIDAAIAYRKRSEAPPTPLTAVEQRIVKGAARPKGTGHSQVYWCRRNQLQRTAIRKAARATRGGWEVRRRGDRYQLLGASFRAHCR